jgi:hypothetical protein
MAVSNRLGSKIDSLSTLSPDALYALAARSTPESIIDDVATGRIESSPTAIRSEIARRKGANAEGVGGRRAAWRALDALIARYPDLNQQSLAAELIVRVACVCACPNWKKLEQNIECYPDEAQDEVRDGVHALARSLSQWANARP